MLIQQRKTMILLCSVFIRRPDRIAGVYIESDAEIRNIARGFCSSLTSKQMDEILGVLKDIAPKVSPCKDPRFDSCQ